MLHLLNNTVLPHSEDDIDLTKHMKTAILQYLNEKYSDPATNDLLDMASFVNPRLKDKYITDGRREYIKTRAAAEIQAQLGMQALSAIESPPQTSTAAADGVEEKEPKKVKMESGQFFQKSVRSAWPNCSTPTFKLTRAFTLRSFYIRKSQNLVCMANK